MHEHKLQTARQPNSITNTPKKAPKLPSQTAITPIPATPAANHPLPHHPSAHKKNDANGQQWYPKP